MTLIEAADKVLELYTCGMLTPQGNSEAVQAMIALREAKEAEARREMDEWHRGERQWERA